MSGIDLDWFVFNILGKGKTSQCYPTSRCRVSDVISYEAVVVVPTSDERIVCIFFYYFGKAGPTLPVRRYPNLSSSGQKIRAPVSSCLTFIPF